LTAGAAIAVLWALLGALHCSALLHGAIALARRCPQLGSLRPRDPEAWPSLSIVVTACNEADTIGPAVASLLSQDYPELRLVLVDDRSSDGTSELVDRFAREDPRVTAVHVRALPDGWLGKVHALQRGVELADGAWVLFADADVRLAPGSLRRAVACAEERRLDHLAVLAQVVLRSFAVGACHGAVFRGILALARPWEAADPASEKAIGTGAFNLVRRAAFDRTPGFEWLRLEVADDIGLGLMMKRSGARPGLMLGRGQVIVEWYRTWAEAVRGLEKNGFAQAARFSLWRGLGMAAASVAVSLGPFAAFLPVGVPWLWMLGTLALAAHLAAAVIAGRATGSPITYAALSLPLGDFLTAYVVARATVLGVRRGGVTWRETVYPTSLLRGGRRVDM
jgi:glycosyltransferase involved in cell wall biosynthesis